MTPSEEKTSIDKAAGAIADLPQLHSDNNQSEANNNEKEASTGDEEAAAGGGQHGVGLGAVATEVIDDFAGQFKSYGYVPGVDEATKARLFKEEGVRVGLKQRHIQMLALAGAIGTGIFLGSGKALARAGPVSLLLGYATVGSIVIAMMLSLCEVATLAPVTSSYIRHSSFFADDAFSFAVGWNLAYGSAVSVPGEVVSCYVLVQFWNDSINPAVFVTIFAIIIVLSNLISAFHSDNHLLLQNPQLTWFPRTQ